MNILTLDPGGTTGASWWELRDDEPIKLIATDQWSGGVAGVILESEHVAEADRVIAESFVLDGRTPFPDVTPLRIEGALMAIRSEAGKEPPLWQRNYAKKHAPDALLKRAGLWQKGMPHANDAIRHAIAWAKTRGHRPTIEWLWPAPEELR